MHAIPARRRSPITSRASSLLHPNRLRRRVGPRVRTFRRRSVLARDPCASPFSRAPESRASSLLHRSVFVAGAGRVSVPSVVGACLHAIPARRRSPELRNREQARSYGRSLRIAVPHALESRASSLLHAIRSAFPPRVAPQRVAPFVPRSPRYMVTRFWFPFPLHPVALLPAKRKGGRGKVEGT